MDFGPSEWTEGLKLLLYYLCYCHLFFLFNWIIFIDFLFDLRLFGKRARGSSEGECPGDETWVSYCDRTGCILQEWNAEIKDFINIF